jgi:putative ABC transport system permease protein
MLRVTFKGVRGHFVRFLLTVAAVTLGTALIAGTYVLTDSINKTFDQIFDSAAVGQDVVVRGAEAGELGDGSGASIREQLPLSMEDTLRDIPGVSRVEPEVTGTIVLVGKDGSAVRNGQAPNLGFGSVPDSPVITVADGRLPERPDEIAVETGTLELSGLSVGDSTQALIGRTPAEVTIVGRIDFGSPLAGATMVLIDMDTAKATFAPDGMVPSFTLAADEGISEQQLRDTVAGHVPPEVDVVTATDATEEGKKDLRKALGFITTFLLWFAGISIFVGGFIIFNTFSMLVAQRMRELALLRVLGASQGQIIRMVLGEAVLVGFFGGLAGLGIGIGLARGLQGVFGSFGLEISGGLPVLPHTIIWTMSVGVGVTMAAALWPALRASRIPPMAALREDQVRPAKGIRRLGVAGLVLFLLGAGLLTVVVRADSVNWWGFLAGVLLALAGALAASPLLARPVVRVVAWPFVLTMGIVGRLARENGLRLPRRTAITASALAIGVTLITGISVMAESTKASVSNILDRQLTADLVLDAGGVQTFPTEVITEAAQVPGVESAVGISGMILSLGEGAFAGQGTTTYALSADSEGLADNMNIPMESGSLSVLDDGELVVDSKVAADNGWAVGDELPAVIGSAGNITVTIGALTEPNSLLDYSMVVPRSLYEETVPPTMQGEYYGYIRLEPGADEAAVREQLVELVKPYLVVSVQDSEEYKNAQAAQVDTMLKMMYALLALSVIIAVLGIVNTLALSVFERTREIGLLRAVGLSRAQLSRSITVEAIATAILGAVIGTVLGLGLGVAIQRALEPQGLESLAIPWGTLVVIILASALAGVVAARLPAGRAVRLDVLKAISSE